MGWGFLYRIGIESFEKFRDCYMVISNNSIIYVKERIKNDIWGKLRRKGEN